MEASEFTTRRPASESSNARANDELNQQPNASYPPPFLGPNITVFASHVIQARSHQGRNPELRQDDLLRMETPAAERFDRGTAARCKQRPEAISEPLPR